MKFEAYLDRFPIGRFRKAVVMESPLGVSEVSNALTAVTRKPFALGQIRTKRFAGHVGLNSGRIRFDPSPMRPNARALKFTLTPTATGCRLDGELIVMTQLRVFVLTYLLFCAVAGPWTAIESFLHGGSLWLALRYLLLACVGAAVFIYGYTGLVLLFTRRTERLGLKVLQYILAGPPSSTVALDLLNSR